MTPLEMIDARIEIRENLYFYAWQAGLEDMATFHNCILGELRSLKREIEIEQNKKQKCAGCNENPTNSKWELCDQCTKEKQEYADKASEPTPEISQSQQSETTI